MSADIAHPISLTPDTWPNTDLRIQLHTHLKIPFERRLWNLQCPADARIALKPTGGHGLEVSLLVSLVGAVRSGSEGSRWWTVDGFIEDWVFRIMLFHSGEVVGTFQQVLPLAGCIFRSNRLAVDALCRETLLCIDCVCQYLYCMLSAI